MSKTFSSSNPLPFSNFQKNIELCFSICSIQRIKLRSIFLLEILAHSFIFRNLVKSLHTDISYIIYFKKILSDLLSQSQDKSCDLGLFCRLFLSIFRHHLQGKKLFKNFTQPSDKLGNMEKLKIIKRYCNNL